MGLEEGKTVSGTRAKFESTGEDIFTTLNLIGNSIFSTIFTEYTTLTDHHMWLRGKADKNGYFTFQSRTSGLFLTAVNPFRTTIESKFGYWFCFWALHSMYNKSTCNVANYSNCASNNLSW